MAKHYVLLGDPVCLICGYNLDSNPPAVITWTGPYGKVVTKNMDSYIMDNGPQVVQLNITNADESDGGRWTCNVRVSDECVHRVVDGILKDECTAIARNRSFDTQLVVVGEYFSSCNTTSEQFCIEINNFCFSAS